MSVITASPEIDISALEGAPDEEWLRKFNESYNELGRQVVANANQNTPFLNSPVSMIKPYDLVHASSVTIQNPLSVPIRAIYPVACVGLSVDSTGKPTRGVYNLAMPDIEWHNSTRNDGSVVITAQFQAPLSGSGAQGETQQISRLFASATAITSGNQINVCAQPSITVGPGLYTVVGAVAFNPAAATNATYYEANVSLTSASLPASSRLGVPASDGTFRISTAIGSNVPVNTMMVGIPSYKLEVATGSTATLFLVARTLFTVSTMTTHGFLEITRTAPYMTGITGRVGLLFIGGGE